MIQNRRIYKLKIVNSYMKKDCELVINFCNQPINFYNDISYFKLNKVITIL